jgi:hypothetical protein
MIILSPGFLLMLAVAATGMWRVRVATAPLRDDAQKLSDAEREELKALLKAKTGEADMPSKYQAHARAAYSVRRLYFLTYAALMAVFLSVVFLDWGLGIVEV